MHLHHILFHHPSTLLQTALVHFDKDQPPSFSTRRLMAAWMQPLLRAPTRGRRDNRADGWMDATLMTGQEQARCPHGSTGHHRLWRPETVGSNIHFGLACRNIACDGVFEDLQNLRATLLAGMESGGATDKRAVDEGQKPPQKSGSPCSVRALSRIREPGCRRRSERSFTLTKTPSSGCQLITKLFLLQYIGSSKGAISSSETGIIPRLSASFGEHLRYPEYNRGFMQARYYFPQQTPRMTQEFNFEQGRQRLSRFSVPKGKYWRSCSYVP